MLSFLKTHFSHPKTNKAFWILIALDILFIVTHAVFIFLIFIRLDFNWSISESFLINIDGTYPEVFQYLKYSLIVLLIIYMKFKKKVVGYLSWLFIFMLLLLDDALRFHELFGTWVAKKLNYVPMFGLRAQDLGELTYVVIFGSIVFFLMFIEYRVGTKDYKKRCFDICLLFALFLFFGIGIDLLHEFVRGNRYVQLSMLLLEDGGEMIALSFITWYFLFITIKPEDYNHYLYDYLFKNGIHLVSHKGT